MLIVLLLQFLLLHTSCTAATTVDDLYPVEFGTPYDHKILDVHHPQGSPYGGFGRHARETLARLPLILRDDDTNHEISYYSVRDQNGQLLACRLYSEDALDVATSLKDSMFNPPVLARPKDSHERTTVDPITSSKVAAAVVPVAAVSEPPTVRTLPATTRVIRSTEPSVAAPTAKVGGAIPTASSIGSSSSSGSSHQDPTETVTTHNAALQSDDDEVAYKVEASLQALQGVCGQVHKGFWSYEWCFEQDVTQFHVEYDTKTNQVKVEQVTHLGKFHHRDLHLDLQEPNEWAEASPEVARIIDAHMEGSTCDGGAPRQSYAKLQCCSEKIIQRHKGMLHKDGRPLKSDILAVLDVVEDPDIKCMYNFTICTPLLCGSDEENEDETPAEDPLKAARLLEDLNSMDEINVDESIRQILDRTLTQLCLQTQAGGWWVYEICHKKTIRQFHESVGIRRNSAGAKVSSKVVESEHILGKYDPSAESQVKDEVEWEFVVNATAGTSWGEGNGAYYQVEYTGGDSCDTSDVTDSAIVAGTAGKTILRRAASVRYHCGQNFDVQVSEDTTCHYIVEVKVPGLCRHPLFRAPVSKKQVMKCLPVEDTY